MNAYSRILVVGASSAMGLCIVGLLRARNIAVTATFRTLRPGWAEAIDAIGAVPVRLGLGNREALRLLLDDHDAAIFTPILLESIAAAPMLKRDQGAVFFSSNNVAIDPNDPVYAALARGEETLKASVPQAVILRPTMIYGHPSDVNMSRLLREAMRWPVLFRPAGCALQQPVFYRDLAEVAVQRLLDRDQKGGVLAVGGPDILTYRQLFAAVLTAAKLRRVVLPVPIAAALVAERATRRLGLTSVGLSTRLKRTWRDKRATGDTIITTTTPLATGLRELAETLKRGPK